MGSQLNCFHSRAPQERNQGRDRRSTPPSRMSKKRLRYDVPVSTEIDPANTIPELNNIFTASGRQLLLDLFGSSPQWLSASVAPRSRYEELVRIQTLYRELSRRGWYDVQPFLVLPHCKGRYLRFQVTYDRTRKHQQAIREVLLSPNAPWKASFGKENLAPTTLAQLQQPIKGLHTVTGLYNMMVHRNVPPHIAIYFCAQPCCLWFAFQEMLLDFNQDMASLGINIGDCPTRAQLQFLDE